ncbi:MAG: DUF4350 domain-containing protein [Planctomycetota bacterium]
MNRLVLAAVALGLTALVAVLLFRVFEFKQVEVPKPPSREARRNPFLALERFGELMGLEVRTRATFEAPAEDVSLFWVVRARTLERDVERLSAWVADGGRLWIVVDPRTAIEAALEERLLQWVDDPLLDAFGLEWTLASAGTSSDSALVDGEEYRVRLSGPVDIGGSADDFIDEEGFLADVLHGEGTVVVSATGHWLSNDALGERDHAELFWELVQREQPITGLVIVRSSDGYGVAAWLSGPGVSLAAVLFLAIAFLIARRGMRLGPLLPELPRGRRDFTEHLAATGTFLWARSDRRRLVQSLRAAVAPEAPDPGPEREAWLERVALRTGLEGRELRAAWNTQRTPDAKTFIHTVRTLAVQARDTDPSRDPR